MIHSILGFQMWISKRIEFKENMKEEFTENMKEEFAAHKTYNEVL